MEQPTAANAYGMAMGDTARSETANPIAADKVEGTNVDDPSGNKLGSIDTLMINKSSGRV